MSEPHLAAGKRIKATPAPQEGHFLARPVAIDCRFLGGHGIGTYVANLLEGAGRGPVGRAPTLVLCGSPQVLEPFRMRIPGSRSVPFHARPYTLHEQVAAWSLEAKSLAWHAPHFNVPLGRREPLIVTIHDLTHLSFGTRFYPWWAVAYVSAMVRYAVERARRVIVVSQTTRREIIERTRVKESKIRVVLNGVSDLFFQPIPKEEERYWLESLSLFSPYFLYVGSFRPHKNVDVLLQAFEKLRARRHELELVIVGTHRGRFQRRGNPEVLRECPGVRIHENLPREAIRTLYARARAVVVPSRSEGFGFPAAEAFACGSPVVLSRAGSLAEIGGDATLYFDPDSPSELEALLDELASSEPLRSAMIEKGRVRAQRFRADRMWTETQQVYEEVLGEL